MKIKYKAALGMSKLNPDGVVTKGKNNLTLMNTAPAFAGMTWPIPITTADAALNDLHDSILLAANGTPGSISNMHEKQRIAVSLFNVYKPFVEMVANNTADPKTVIESVGMTAVVYGGSSPVTDLTLSAVGNGTVEISVPRQTGESAFIYQYSSDGGTTWQDVECSKLATILHKNQTPASTLQYRFAAIGKTKGAFSQPKSIIVL
jgi:hypothetical protein